MGVGSGKWQVAVAVGSGKWQWQLAVAVGRRQVAVAGLPAVALAEAEAGYLTIFQGL